MWVFGSIFNQTSHNEKTIILMKKKYVDCDMTKNILVLLIRCRVGLDRGIHESLLMKK